MITVIGFHDHSCGFPAAAMQSILERLSQAIVRQLAAITCDERFAEQREHWSRKLKKARRFSPRLAVVGAAVTVTI
jgi:hypothetical protein